MSLSDQTSAEPGLYTVTVRTLDKNTFKGLIKEAQIHVVEQVTSEDETEIYCPDVINPGNFFECRMDVPKGNLLKAHVQMIDDVKLKQGSANQTMTTNVNIPDKWWDVPGNPIYYGAYNTSQAFTSKGEESDAFVLMSSHFKNPANISWIEFVPMSKGLIHIDLVEAVCPSDKAWCPMTAMCENECVASFQAKPTSEADQTCPANDHFCAGLTTTSFLFLLALCNEKSLICIEEKSNDCSLEPRGW